VCPRSRSRLSAAKEDGSYDVIIVGAGCVGAAIARELSRYSLSVLVLESADDVTQGATKGNSGVVHAGYDDAPGSVRAKFCWKGNQMFADLDRELRFGYQKNGSLVLATNAEEVAHLHELLERGRKNGVERLAILQRDEVLKLEPYVTKEVIAALYSPDAGNLIPYEFTIALMENAVDNGVELRIRRHVDAVKDLEDGSFEVSARHWESEAYFAAPGKVEKRSVRALWLGVVMGFSVVLLRWLEVPIVTATVIALVAFYFAYRWVLGKHGSGGVAAKGPPPSIGKGGSILSPELMAVGGSGCSAATRGKTVEQETFRCKMVINCAGSFSDKIANMVGDHSFKIEPRLGDYLLLNRNQGKFAKCTLFPCPGPLGKGILVQQTLWGNLILGPTARDLHIRSTWRSPQKMCSATYCPSAASWWTCLTPRR
jgi:L-2-hydroxyglutarate oxidase LhgO